MPMNKIKIWIEKFPELDEFIREYYDDYYRPNDAGLINNLIETIDIDISDLEELTNKKNTKKEIKLNEQKKVLYNRKKDIIKAFQCFKKMTIKLAEIIKYQHPLVTLSKFSLNHDEFTIQQIFELGDDINDFNICKSTTGDSVCCVCKKHIKRCMVFEYIETVQENIKKFKNLGIKSKFVIGSDCIDTVSLVQYIAHTPELEQIYEEKLKEWTQTKVEMDTKYNKAIADKKKTAKCVKCEKLFEPYMNIGITTPMNVCKKCNKKIIKDREAEKVKKELEKQKQVEENIKQNREKILMIRKEKKEEDELYNLYWETYQW